MSNSQSSPKGSPNRDRMELLDRALEGRPAEVRARVLDLILRMGIDPRDEFFLIFIALGQLQVLIEDSPKDWQALFVSFEGELRGWEQNNITTLEHLVHQVETMESLADSSKQLTAILNDLVRVCEGLTPSLERSTKVSQRLLEELPRLFKETTSTIRLIGDDLTKQRSMLLEQFRIVTSNLEAIHQTLDLLELQNRQRSNSQGWNEHPMMRQFFASFLGALVGFAFLQMVLYVNSLV